MSLEKIGARIAVLRCETRRPAPVNLYTGSGRRRGGNWSVGTAKVDEKGRVLIPLEDRLKAGLKPGVKLDVRKNKDGLLLTPILPRPVRVKSGRAKWGKEAFSDAGEATFGS